GGEGGTLDAAISGEPDRFDPHLTSAYASFQVLENVYDTLVQPGDDLTMEPALATDWEVSDDNLTWTFELREGVKWHNGRDFVADDVVFSFERIMDEEVGAANAYRFENVESVTAPDDATVEIAVTEPTPNLLELIGAFKGMSIVPREIVEDGSIDDQPVGTGPFRFVEYVANDRIVLERNPDYWQDGKPHVDRVVYRPIPDETVMLTNLRTGEVDWIDSIPPQQVDQLSGSDDIVVESTPSSDYWYLAMNLEREPFGERDVRRAVATAIDRAAVTEAAKFEAATPNQAAIPETSFWYHEYAPYEPDVEEAKRLLEGAGAGDGFPMEIMVTDEYPETVTAAQVIESQLEPLGIDVNIRTLDFATWLDEQGKGNFDAFLLGWLGNIDPHDYYYAQHHTGEGFNFHGYSNPEVDELLEQGAVQTDRDERKKIYDEAAELIVDDASYVYLYNPDTVNAWRPQLSGFNVRGDAAIRFEDVQLQD
ncbi:MAG: ABC transporter substrate-binding protein, partial [Actinobacteria bacterium]|nr:ABC transporter substrate-binding protein [Actinomycetota bacterium]